MLKPLSLLLLSIFPFSCLALSQQEVYLKLMVRKNAETYQEGVKWDNNKVYKNKVWFHDYPPGYFTGIACYSFVMDMMEYVSDYNYIIRRVDGTYDNLPTLHVGDGIRLKNDCHSAIVLSIDPDGHTVSIAEGNYGGRIHWGRKIDLADPRNGFTYASTFWKSPSQDEYDSYKDETDSTYFKDKSKSLMRIITVKVNGKPIEVGSLGNKVCINGKEYIIDDRRKNLKLR